MFNNFLATQNFGGRAIAPLPPSPYSPRPLPSSTTLLPLPFVVSSSHDVISQSHLVSQFLLQTE